MTNARTLVKPYWVRIGSGGFAIQTDRDLVRAFFGDIGRDAENQRAFELISTNPYGNLRARGYYWDAAYIEHEIVGKGSGLVMIPGDWPEPKDGPVWEHVVPFTPQPTACKAGKAQAHPGVSYRVRQSEQPWDVAMRFGQPYKAWVKLRQANHDDPAGFSRPAKDAGICTFSDWRAGKWINIPQDWPLPEPQSPLWQDMTMARALGAVGAPNTSEALPPRKDTLMQPHTIPYRIQRGDTPGMLAGRHGVTKEDLFQANPKMLTMRDRFGEKNFHPLSFQRGAVLNIPVPSGAVSGPTGNVGAPSITSPMMTFKGASGITSPMMTFKDWGLKHPQWNGTNEAYWSQRIVATASRVPGLIDRPNLQAYVLAFLRSYPNVQAFKAAMQTANYTQPYYPYTGIRYPDEGMWYAEPQDRDIAFIAARRLAALPGMAIGAMNGPSGAVGCGGRGGCNYGMPEQQGCQCGSPGYCPSCGRDGALGACGCGQGYIGAPSGAVGAAGSGQVGAWVTCTSPTAGSVEAAKGVAYRVQSGEYMHNIVAKFGQPEGAWADLRDANPNMPMARDNAPNAPTKGVCLLSIKGGDMINVPLAWLLAPRQQWKTAVPFLYAYDPMTEQYTPIASTGFCPAGTTRDPSTSNCVIGGLPPGTSLPIGGQCPAGTTNVAGICVPNLGYPMPQGGCLPGTTLDPADGMCKPPGGSIVVPGVPPVNGQCPTGMRLYSDNLCYVPGSQPSGLKLVSLTTEAEDDSIPTWVWVVGGIGAAAAAVGIAMMAGKKKPDKKKPAREPEFFEEEEVIY